MILSSLLVGTMGRALELAVEHAKNREQFGVKIGTFQAIKHLCADMFVDVWHLMNLCVAAEVRRLMLALPHVRSYVCYSRPGPQDKMAEDFDAIGHLSRSAFAEVGIPRDADVYLCGPTRFMGDMKEALGTLGVAPGRIHLELFNGSESMTPGVVGVVTRPPHPPGHDAGNGPLVSFARSGSTAHWDGMAYQSLLELAEACDKGTIQNIDVEPVRKMAQELLKKLAFT